MIRMKKFVAVAALAVAAVAAVAAGVSQATGGDVAGGIRWGGSTTPFQF